MPNTKNIFSQPNSPSLVVEQLPDGSTVIFDERSKSVHSLDPSATVVWRACAAGATLPRIVEALAAHFGAPVNVEVASNAIAQLQQAKLIESGAPTAVAVPVAGAVKDLGRRSILKGVGSLGALAVPVVLTLTAAEQRAYAVPVQAGSGTTTTRPPA